MNKPSEPTQPLPGESHPPINLSHERPIEKKALPDSPSADDRHRRKCRICRHPEREAIEQEYRDWHSPSQIARHYHLPDRPLYRHLHAAGLVSSRRENLRMILDRIIERGAEKPVSGDTIIRAIRAQCCLTDDNKWVEPAKHVIFSKDQQPPREPKESLAGQSLGRDTSSGREVPNESEERPVDRGVAPDTNNWLEPPNEFEESFVGRGLGPDITNRREAPHQCAESPAASIPVPPGMPPQILIDSDTIKTCAM